MNIIVCLDDKNGMQFNRRRQSRDEAVYRKILELSALTELWVNSYSENLFERDAVKVSEDFLRQAKSGEFCFVEDQDVLPYSDRIEKIYVFRWNRVYPSDREFPTELIRGEKKVITEFAGKSHPLITLEVY